MVESWESDKLKQSLTVAEMYYENGLSQAEIARSLKISRPTISRLLQFATDKGIDRIQIVNPLVDAQVIGTQLKQKYGVDVQVVPNQDGRLASLEKRGGKYAADFLTKVVRPGDTIGLGWGKTVHSVTQQLEEQAAAGIRVVELKGSVRYSGEKTWAYESVNELAKAYHTTPEYLPLPVIFDNPETKRMVEQDRYIKHILDLGKAAEVALFTVGSVCSDALLFRLGYFNEQEKYQLQQTAVGDIFSRFIDDQGRIVNQQINDRTIGINLGDLKAKRHAILVATGNRKAKGVHAVLTAGYANHAIIDQNLAQQLIDI